MVVIKPSLLFGLIGIALVYQFYNFSSYEKSVNMTDI